MASQLDEFSAQGVSLRTAEHVAGSRELLERLQQAINRDLTSRQRQVIVGEVAGIPQVVLAEHLNARPGAICKLAYAARRSLRAALERSGFDGPTVKRLMGTAPTEFK